MANVGHPILDSKVRASLPGLCQGPGAQVEWSLWCMWWWKWAPVICSPNYC